MALTGPQGLSVELERARFEVATFTDKPRGRGLSVPRELRATCTSNLAVQCPHDLGLAALAQSLTVDIQARPAYDTIRIIAETTGQKLGVDGVLRNEILVVRVKDSSAQLEAMQSGGLRLDRLSDAQRQRVSQAFYNLEGDSGRASEPTEVAPRGLDSSVRVTLKSESAVVASCRPRGSLKSTPAHVAARLADYHFGNFPGGAPELTELEYRLGTRITYRFAIVVGEDASRELNFEDAAELAATWVPFDQLPAEFQSQMAARFAEMRAMRNGGSRPPP